MFKAGYPLQDVSNVIRFLFGEIIDYRSGTDGHVKSTRDLIKLNKNDF